MKKFMAIMLAASFAFGSSVLVFANQTPPMSSVAATAVANVAFKGVERTYVTEDGSPIGKYLTFSNNDVLSKKIFTSVNDTYWHMVTNENYEYTSDQGYIFNYNLEETATAARIEIIVTKFNIATKKFETSTIATYYIDKTDNSEISLAAYSALRDAEAASEEVEESEEAVEVEEGSEAPVLEEAENGVLESVTVPLRVVAESNGFEVLWDDGAVVVAKDDIVVKLVTGSNVYVNADGEEVELEGAPENIGGILYVPASFFSELLGIEVSAQ